MLIAGFITEMGISHKHVCILVLLLLSSLILLFIIIIIIIIIIITSETSITIYNYKSHRKLVNVKGLEKK